MKAGLMFRLAVAGAVLGLFVGAGFAILLSAAAELRQLQQQARRSEQTLAVANLLERLVVDVETGQRGFIITGQEDLLQPLQVATTTIPQQLSNLKTLVTGSPEQLDTVGRIDQVITSYLNHYSLPLIATARRDPAAARTLAVTLDGKARVDAIRAEFDRFLATETTLAQRRQQQADEANRRATLAAVACLGSSLLVIAALAGYAMFAIARPVRRAAAMAGRISGGDLSARLPERGPGEVGMLERSFNSMARSLRESNAELAASRARIVTAADQERRRIERNLHDGIQQRLVTLVLELRTADPPESPDGQAQLDRIADELGVALDELRELSRGIHPSILTEGGLGPAIKAVARRSAVPVDLDLQIPGRLPDAVEVAAYYVVSEALANVAKHANAYGVQIDAMSDGDQLRLTISDDGVGGTTARSGSGLIGLMDRVNAVGGTMSISSPPGQGTTLHVELPLQPAGG